MKEEVLVTTAPLRALIVVVVVVKEVVVAVVVTVTKLTRSARTVNSVGVKKKR